MRDLLALAVIAFSLAASAALDAQGMLEQLTDPDAKRPTIDESVSASWGFERGARNRNDRFRSWSLGFNLSAPIPIFGIPSERGGGRLADPSESNETGESTKSWPEDNAEVTRPAKQDGIEGGLLLMPSYRYTALRNDRDTLPRRVVSAGGSLFGFAGFEATSRKIRFGTFLRWQVNSDMEETGIGDGQYLLTAFALVPANEDWYFTPGIGYVSDFALTFLEGVPLPSLEVIYAPRGSSFLAAFGLPFNLVQYRPVPWLSLFAISFAGPYGQLAVSQQVSDNFVFRQSFGTSSSVVNLTARQYPKDSRLFERSLYASVSVEFKLPRRLSLSLSYDHEFQHRFWIESPRVNGDMERLDLKDGGTVNLSFTLKF